MYSVNVSVRPWSQVDTRKYSIKWCYWQARSWSKRVKSKMELQTVSKFLCSSHWTHSWSTPHKTIPNKEPRVYDCTWNLQHKSEQYWWQAPPPWSHQQASHLWDFQLLQVHITATSSDLVFLSTLPQIIGTLGLDPAFQDLWKSAEFIDKTYKEQNHGQLTSYCYWAKSKFNHQASLHALCEDSAVILAR